MARGEWIAVPGMKTPSGAPAGPTPMPQASAPPSAPEGSSAAPEAAVPSTAPESPAPSPEQVDAAAPHESFVNSWILQPEFRNTILGSTFASTEDAIKILTKYDPSLKVDRLDSGTVLFKRKDGSEFKIAPGMHRWDNIITAFGAAAVPTLTVMALTAAAPSAATLPVVGPLVARAAPLLSRIAASSPAWIQRWAPRAMQIAKGAAGAAAEQTVAEVGKATQGIPISGDNITNAALAGGGFRAALGAGRMAGRGMNAAVDSISPVGGRQLPVQSASEIGGAVASAAPDPEALIFKSGDDEALRAAQNAFSPEQTTLNAARHFGVDAKDVPLAVATGNPAMRQVMKTLSAEGLGSEFGAGEKQRMEALVPKVREALKRIASNPEELSDVSDSIERQLLGEADKLAKLKRAQYGRLEWAIPPSEPVDTSPALNYIKNYEKKLVEKKATIPGAEYNTSPLMEEAKKLLTPVEVKITNPRTGKTTVRTERATYTRLQEFVSGLKESMRGQGQFSQDRHRHLAPELVKRLEPALLKAAEDAGEKEALLAARAATREFYAKEGMREAAFGSESQNSIVDAARRGMAEGIEGLDPKKMWTLLEKLPPERRKDVVQSAFIDHLAQKDISGFNRFWEKVQSHDRARDLLLTHMQHGSRKELDKLYNLTSAIERAEKAVPLTQEAMRPDAGIVQNFIGQVADVARIGTLSMPWRVAGMARMFIGMLKNPGDPKVKMVLKWLNAPETRAVLLRLNRLGPPPEGMLRKMVNSPAFKPLRRIVDMGPNEVKWVGSLIRSSMYPSQGSEE